VSRQGGRCPIFQTGRLADGRVSILRSAVLPTTNSTGAGEGHKMSKAADISEPASEVQHLMADLSGLGPLVFVFGDDFAVTHLAGAITPVFRGPADRRWWHVTLGDDAASPTIDVRVDQITGGRCDQASQMSSSSTYFAPSASATSALSLPSTPSSSANASYSS
jgi:hypothetical protein